ncbi:hypothetical protein [Desulfurispira natronophila]|uniref:Cytochrome c553 n=1 Tax=Desulfurispira natronophila TaxID=682562 RepID=A0A7W7Y3A6_9BACT|nr:hypothetical protein [Desulfurispira natronophila]MBB5021310.1 cytochrome c553 [Desulfurispira natronophila]
MKKTLYVLMVLCMFAGVNAYAKAPLACNACHINISEERLDGGKAHPIQYEGITNRMTNPMHGTLTNCSACHDIEGLSSASSPSASLLGGSVEALGARPSCAGCHSGAVASKPEDWDMERVKLHTFSK